MMVMVVVMVVVVMWDAVSLLNNNRSVLGLSLDSEGIVMTRNGPW